MALVVKRRFTCSGIPPPPSLRVRSGSCPNWLPSAAGSGDCQTSLLQDRGQRRSLREAPESRRDFPGQALASWAGNPLQTLVPKGLSNLKVPAGGFSLKVLLDFAVPKDFHTHVFKTLDSDESRPLGLAALRTGGGSPGPAPTGKWPTRPHRSARSGDTSVPACWKGVSHFGRRAAQGIPTQVPSCRKESKTPPEAATVGGPGTAPSSPRKARTVLALLPEGWGLGGHRRPPSWTSAPPQREAWAGCRLGFVLRCEHWLLRGRRVHRLPVSLWTPALTPLDGPSSRGQAAPLFSFPTGSSVPRDTSECGTSSPNRLLLSEASCPLLGLVRVEPEAGGLTQAPAQDPDTGGPSCAQHCPQRKGPPLRTGSPTKHNPVSVLSRFSDMRSLPLGSSFRKTPVLLSLYRHLTEPF